MRHARRFLRETVPRLSCRGAVPAESFDALPIPSNYIRKDRKERKTEHERI